LPRYTYWIAPFQDDMTYHCSYDVPTKAKSSCTSTSTISSYICTQLKVSNCQLCLSLARGSNMLRDSTYCENMFHTLLYINSLALPSQCSQPHNGNVRAQAQTLYYISHLPDQATNVFFPLVPFSSGCILVSYPLKSTCMRHLFYASSFLRNGVLSLFQHVPPTN